MADFDVIYSESPKVEWEHVVGLDDAKTSIQESIVLPFKFPNLFKDARFSMRSNILLFRPPGTGKTHLVRAASTTTNSTLLRVCCLNLMKKENPEMLVKKVFQLAQESTSAIIFLDKIEALCAYGPQENDEEWSKKRRNVIVELLILMSGPAFYNRSLSVAIVAATDAPWLISSLILRRFLKRRYCPLLDHNARRRILEIGIGNRTPSDLCPADYEILVGMTSGHPGSTISLVINCALTQPSKRLASSTHFKQIATSTEGGDSVTKWMSCSPEDPEAVNVPNRDIQWDKVVVPPLILADFMVIWEHADAREKIPQTDIEKYEKWMESVGTIASSSRSQNIVR